MMVPLSIAFWTISGWNLYSSGIWLGWIAFRIWSHWRPIQEQDTWWFVVEKHSNGSSQSSII